ADLLARVRAHLRRSSHDEDERVITLGDVTVDLAARRTTVAGSEIDLRPKEFDLLALLLRRAGTVVTREQAMEQVWDEHWFGSTKTLDVTLASLRQRLGETGPDTSRITTLRGVGYRYEQPAGPGA
ncbi:MAG: response regulator transcription factor, partial [Acidimicrobiales bacterium]